MPRPQQNQKPISKGHEFSGAEKERRKRKKEEEDKIQAEQIKKFFVRAAPTQNSENSISSEPFDDNNLQNQLKNPNYELETGKNVTETTLSIPPFFDVKNNSLEDGITVLMREDAQSSTLSTVDFETKIQMDDVNQKFVETHEWTHSNIEDEYREQENVNEKLIETQEWLPQEIVLEMERTTNVEVKTQKASANFLLLDLSDPSTWPFPLTSIVRQQLLEVPLKHAVLKEFPRNEQGRRFNPAHYKYTNELKSERDWLLFSKTTNSLFCFSCCLFSDGRRDTLWTNYGPGTKGFDGFKHQAQLIAIHEVCDAHFNSYMRWKEFLKNRNDNRLINSKLDDEMRKTESFWVQVLKALLDVIFYLAKNNLAFRGASDNINDNNCGNFLSLVKLLAKHNGTLALHVERLEKSKLSYLSPKIQNEFISMAGNSVRKSILKDIAGRQFYSIMFDSTPDTSKKEQISQIIRSVKISEEGCKIEEHFIDFIHCDEKTGEQISKLILKKLEDDGLDVQRCRGQGYDNASNMSGKYKGVQARIKEVNPFAEFLPCQDHSWNLIGQNAAASNITGKLGLGQIQNLFLFFSASPNRWNFLKKYVKCSLKSKSDTRWSANSDAVGTVWDEFEVIGDCLFNMVDAEIGSDFNSETIAGDHSRLQDIWNFRFLLSTCIWNFILGRINVCNLAVQGKDSTLDQGIMHIVGLLIWLKSFKTSGFNQCLKLVNEKANLLGIEEGSGFSYRLTRNKKPAKYSENPQIKINSPNETINANIARFREDFFDSVLSQLIEENERRFISVKNIHSMFSFLWGEKLESYDVEKQKNSVEKLCFKFPKDFQKERFQREIQFLSSSVKPFLPKDKPLKKSTPIIILNVLTFNSLQCQFENCQTALVMYLTFPVTVASNERAFSKLKIIKNYLRSSMAQERLTNLAILSIEKERAEEIEFDTIIKDFASAKCRQYQG